MGSGGVGCNLRNRAAADRQCINLKTAGRCAAEIRDCLPVRGGFGPHEGQARFLQSLLGARIHVRSDKYEPFPGIGIGRLFPVRTEIGKIVVPAAGQQGHGRLVRGSNAPQRPAAATL